jgi:hypothetical protein
MGYAIIKEPCAVQRKGEQIPSMAPDATIKAPALGWMATTLKGDEQNEKTESQSILQKGSNVQRVAPRPKHESPARTKDIVNGTATTLVTMGKK